MCAVFKFIASVIYNNELSYLRILETELLSQLLTVRLADILLYLKPFLKATSLKVRENCPSHHPSARFSTRVCRPWKHKSCAREIA